MPVKLGQKSLAELFVLAACGEGPALEDADDLHGLVPLGSAGVSGESQHTGIQNASAFGEGQNPLAVQRLEQGRNEAASRMSMSCRVMDFGAGPGDPPRDRPILSSDSG